MGTKHHNDIPINSENHKQTTDFETDCWIIGTAVVKNLIAIRMYRRKHIRITTLKEKTIRGAKTLIKSGKVSAANLILQVGSNAIDFEDNIKVVLAEMKDLIAQYRSTIPDCKAMVGEVLPRYYRYQSERQKFEEKRSRYNSLLKEIEDDLDFTLIEHSNFTHVDFQDCIHPTIDGGVPLLSRNIRQKLNPILGIELNGEYKRRNFTQNRFQEFRSRDNETQ